MDRIDFPPLYAIADGELLRARGSGLREFAENLRDAGVALVQLREKQAWPKETLAHAATLREVFAGSDCRLIMNDRVDLALLAGFDGVHLGQEDLSAADARVVLAGEAGPSGERKRRRGDAAEDPREGCRILGVSTHTEAQGIAADAGSADYVAIGPVFATETKANASAVVGLAGVRRARALTRKPLVAIGGITRANCRSVIEAGADSVAVISALFAAGESVEQVARDFLRILR